MHQNTYKNYFHFILILMLFLSFIFQIKINKYNYVERFKPPGGVEFKDSVFCDKTEISNKDWLEYLSWLKFIYGSKSKIYKSALPDHKVWSSFGIFPSSRAESNYYMQSAKYYSYPLVGISQAQAVEYSKWRTDRVFEHLLIKLKVFKKDPEPNIETFFTIEKYFTGKYRNLIPDTHIKYYLEYKLPNFEERTKILKYSDSVDSAYFDKCHSDFCNYCKENFPMFHSDIIPRNDTIKIEPTLEVTKNFSAKSKNAIYNLRGNVGEWVEELGWTVGGSWNDARMTILKDEKVSIRTCNAWTGFRNICEWKKWKN